VVVVVAVVVVVVVVVVAGVLVSVVVVVVVVVGGGGVGAGIAAVVSVLVVVGSLEVDASRESGVGVAVDPVDELVSERSRSLVFPLPPASVLPALEAPGSAGCCGGLDTAGVDVTAGAGALTGTVTDADGSSVAAGRAGAGGGAMSSVGTGLGPLWSSAPAVRATRTRIAASRARDGLYDTRPTGLVRADRAELVPSTCSAAVAAICACRCDMA